MTDGTFVKAIVDEVAKPDVIGGVLVGPSEWRPIEAKQYAPTPISLTTLRGIKDYAQSHFDAIQTSSLMAVVLNPTQVTVQTALESEEKRFRRQMIAQAGAIVPSLSYGSFLEAENWIVALQVCFKPTADREALLNLLSSIRDSEVRDSNDDGASQEVTTTKGVVVKDRAKIPNPVNLMPYRTFSEVAQPMSQFVVRLKPGSSGSKPTIALFEADGGAWRAEAIANVAAWLNENVPGLVVLG